MAYFETQKCIMLTFGELVEKLGQHYSFLSGEPKELWIKDGWLGSWTKIKATHTTAIKLVWEDLDKCPKRTPNAF